MSDHAIDIEDLIFRWPRQALPCLDIPRFTVQRGERVFLQGPSGSGKSTLLNLLGGVLRPEKGRVQFLDEDLAEASPQRRDRLRADHIGFIFQQFNLLPWMSASDNVCLPCTFSRRRMQRAIHSHSLRAEAERLLRHLELETVDWKRPARALSVGQQQRVAAARALIGQPELIVADEPTSALDTDRQEAFLDLLLRETSATGSTLVFVSHDARLSTHFDRCVTMAEIARNAALGA